ncbi:DUF5753 domain-containing protein [Streptomyces aidingensis]|uniref:DUF5753 domain-containing protein n=1 Tax=Streptomyces aidingensis TaxID=910347 RepID=A0A1I1RBC8_9ACTN|nr:DUF5753 domain-containing protein [Streptomyces aidingensis]SFD31542.1 hypothetical protein SAMN05421773_1138 [Streptomyces aidingensis]
MDKSVDQLIRELRAPEQFGAGRVEQLGYGATNLDRLAAMDANAVVIRSFNLQAIPGLLQTPAYAEEVLSATLPRLPRNEIRRRMLLKSGRSQAFLERARSRSGPKAFFVVGEQALYQSFASVDVHRAQLGHLLHVMSTAYPWTRVQVLPRRAVPAGLLSHLVLWSFDETPETVSEATPSFRRVAYVETGLGGWYSTRGDDLARGFGLFADIVSSSLGEYDSRQAIRTALGE